MKGFTMYLYAKDWFLPSSKKNVTENVAKEFVRKILEKTGKDRRIYPSEIDELAECYKNRIMRATCEPSRVQGFFLLHSKEFGTLIQASEILKEN